MKVAVIYYSTYGHIIQMAEAIKEGVEKSGAASQVDIFQVEETLSDEVLTLLHAPSKPDYPIATNDTLKEYDAFLFGIPTRFGTTPAQFRAFWDRTGGLWASGALYGKPAGMFVSTASLGGGQESTANTFLSQLVHHGMTFIPLGYGAAFPLLTSFDEVHGGSPWGAGTLAAGDGSRQPSKLEKDIAIIQGEQFGKFASRLVKGESATSSGSATATGSGSGSGSGAATGTGSDSGAAAKEAASKPTPAEKDTRANQAKPAQPEKTSSCKCIIM
ncbi:Flavoprotein-like protein YCP4 [Meyerozyma sp. JA9]|nr:Flavoprotein-like protein YCP4 [Meyerozyma sp. JA9]